MDNNVLDNFGKIFIDEVRDYVLTTFQWTFGNHISKLSEKELKNEISKFNDHDKELILRVIADAVDSSMHKMLFMFEEHSENMKLLYNSVDLVEESDGLCGELFVDGWIDKYSKYDEID